MASLPYQIIKQTDRQLFEAFRSLINESPLNFQNASLKPIIGSPITINNLDEINDNEEIVQLLNYDSQSIQSFTYTFDLNVRITVSRSKDILRDDTSFNYPDNQQEHFPKVRELDALARKHLKSFDSRQFIGSTMGHEIQNMFEMREVELAKLESIATDTLSKITKEASELRGNLENEYQERRKTLQDEIDQLRTQINEDHKRRQEKLDKRENELNARLKEIDDRESKFARRGLRQDLKKELARRSERFELTEGTQRLRKPIINIALVLLAVSGIGLIIFVYASAQQLILGIQPTLSQTIELSVRQIIFAIAFGSTAIFLIRWNNQWFLKHTEEEFRQKRLELDIDRASWVFEMALEWQSEKGTEIPETLLNRLSANLFSETNKEEEEPLHPADELASALFGASSKIRIETPIASAELDRKGINKLSKD